MQSGAQQPYDVIIVGAGPVGAVAANLAGAAGMRTLVIERGGEPYKLPRAIVFDAEIMRIFDSIGLAGPIGATTRPLGGSVYLGADRKPIRTFRAHPRANDLAWHPSNLFYQPQLEAILRDGLARFPNVTLLTDHAVTHVDAGAEGATIHATGDGTDKRFTGRFILSCDGASSTVRKALGIKLDDIGFEERWLVIDTMVNGPMRWPSDYEVPAEVKEESFSLMVCDPERPCTLIPGSGRHRRFEYMLLAGEEDAEVQDEPWIRKQIGRWIDPSDVEIVRAAVYRFRALVARNWRSGPIFLVGDAAHQTPPFYGQGMCHGIRDAAQLVWRLKLVLGDIADDLLLDTYQAEREPHVREIITASVTAGGEVCKLHPAEAEARDIAFRKAERNNGARVAMTDIVPPIRVGIVDPISGGMRLPEFAVGEEGRTHIDQLLAGRFTLLTMEDAPPLPAYWQALDGKVIALAANDPTGAARAWLSGRSATWAIVRPDRYVFATGTGDQALVTTLEALGALLHMTSTRPAEKPAQPKEAIAK